MPETLASRDAAPGGRETETVTGEMATIRVLVELPPAEPPYNDPTDETPVVLEQLRKLRRQLHQEIETEIKDALGPEAEVDELLVLPGSVEILAIISTVSMVVTNFNALTDNLEKATERVRRAVRFVLGRIQPIRAGKVEYRIHGDWTPGPAMRRVQRSGAQSPPILAPANSPEQPAVAGGSGLFSPYAGALAGAYGLLLAIIIMLAILVGRG